MARLLMMEDDVEFSFLLQKGLIDAGHEVDIRFSASDAIEALKQSSYDLLITDMIVFDGARPVPDGGISLVTWVRKNPLTSEMPIVAMTGSHKNPGLSDILGIARTMGADEALEKPFLTQDMLATIDRLLKGRDVPQLDGLH